MTCDVPAVAPGSFDLPEGPEVQAMRAGVSWDAVRVPKWLAVPALDRVGDRSGAVIEDRWGPVWYWLIPPGSGHDWQHGHGIEVLGATCWVVVPPARRTSGAGVRWLLPPASGRALLTDADVLRVALASAVADPAGPR